MSMKDLETMCDEILIGNNPKLRAAIRDALDAGASPATIRNRWGLNGKNRSLTACAVEAIIAEWEREVDDLAAKLKTPPKGDS